MEQQNKKGWLYLLPAFAFLAVFMVYPLIDVFIYSFEESFNFASQSYTGVGTFNFSYVLHDPYFLQALKNTFLLVIITVPLSTGLALLISLCLSSIQKLRELFQTVFFLPYVTNTLAVGLVFMILFRKTAYSDVLTAMLLLSMHHDRPYSLRLKSEIRTDVKRLLRSAEASPFSGRLKKLSSDAATMALAEDGLLALYEEYTALESTLDALKITHQYTSNSLIESANAVSQQSWTSIQASKKTLAERYAVIVATVGVTFFLAVFLALFIYRSIVRNVVDPIKRLNNCMLDRVNRIPTPFPESVRYELAEMTSSVRYFTSEIEKHEQELLHSHENLEKQVAERTCELKALSEKLLMAQESERFKLASELHGAKTRPGAFDGIEGLENLDKVIDIDQSPIGRTPRSNPATYTGVFNDIRDLFAKTADAKARGYGPSRFSFNVKGGRCEACSGDGLLKIEMHFLPDVYVPCDVCKGRRYNKETLEVRYKGRNIYEVLDMTVDEACEFFANVPKIARRLETMREVGLGYVKLGQSSTTLSGGEAQRAKLATELSRRSTGKTIYILDEPTTGLHVADVHRLVDVLQKLVDAGNTVVVIEHNLDVIKVADYILDLGPEGGDGGGRLVASGTPEEVAQCEKSYTGRYLGPVLAKTKAAMQAKSE